MQQCQAPRQRSGRPRHRPLGWRLSRRLRPYPTGTLSLAVKTRAGGLGCPLPTQCLQNKRAATASATVNPPAPAAQAITGPVLEKCKGAAWLKGSYILPHVLVRSAFGGTRGGGLRALRASAFFGRSEGATGGGGTDSRPQWDSDARQRSWRNKENLLESLQGGRRVRQLGMRPQLTKKL